ncbi:pyridoxal phosphate-dependent aminotransferase [Actinopolymorpha sp. B17G11]|uniref:pyridoxal phosphate-dependent aminotransferase n=1 Tax=Actinopolymorpha sp. B17G11 TaxID=3160861 RepID=UPI0032E4F4CE
MAAISATLAANEQIRARLARGEPVQHLAFGEAGIPVHPALAEVLRRATGRGGYPSVAGDTAAREAVAGYLGRRGLTASHADPDHVLLAPGSKSLLYAVLAVLPGDVVLPQPSWVSYAAQGALIGKRVLHVPVPAEAGGVPDPALLEEALSRTPGADGSPRPGILVLTSPDNPTGTVAGEALLRDVCAVAERHGLVIVSDQIYSDLTHDGTVPTSPAELVPDRTVVTTGLSKNLALGGWRIGAVALPRSPLGVSLRDSLLQFASEVWSALPGPMQEVAAYAFAEPDDLVAHVEQARRLHGTVARAVHTILLDAGARCRAPQGGFYLYPDFSSLGTAGTPGSIGTTRSVGLPADGESLAETLLSKHGIGVLPGSAFGDDPSRLTFRAATSLLYGTDDEQRWAALRDPDPVRLPWISESLDRLRAGFAALTGAAGARG